jgi:hypothetical protein
LLGAGVRHTWNEEHRKLEEEVAKRSRPELTAEFQTIPPDTLLILYNSSPNPAVNVSVKEIRRGSKVLQSSIPKPVRSGPGTWVECWILENGRRDENNVVALFSGMESVAERSQLVDLEVFFSNQDSAESQKTWVLRGQFYFDKINPRCAEWIPTSGPIHKHLRRIRLARVYRNG